MNRLAPPPATKIVAVHLNYASRAQERGRTPTTPSYFLKPPSSLSVDGAPIVRPRGTELLTFEGEIAVIVGTAARRVTPDEAASHIGWVAPANDVGVYDLRWADRGSNVLSKGHDGFTPLGPASPFAELGEGPLTLRTRVNGDVVQEDSTDTLLFSFAELIADLSRFMTLEPGDIVLTGTPAGSRTLAPGDVVEVEIDGLGRVRNPIVEAEEELASYGAQPRVDDEARAMAAGRPASAPTAARPSDEALALLADVSTATLTVQLRKRGLRDTALRGVGPLTPGRKLVGRAHTLRYVALREDVRDAEPAGLNAQKRAIEAIKPGEVLVIEAREDPGAGTIGDILAARLVALGGVGVVTDGGVRDSAALTALPVPVFAHARHPAVLGLHHHPFDHDVPITCGDVFVLPGDVIVGDDDGVVVVPAALAEEVARDAVEQERREAWALERVQDGDSVAGVYPLGDERRQEYEHWVAGGDGAAEGEDSP